MKPEVEALARHRRERARDALDEGEHLLSRKRPAGAVSRVYYAAFYAAKALLATRELDSARHSGVIALFHTHFVRGGFVETDRARALSRAFEKRQKGDYGDFATVTLEEAGELRDEVRLSKSASACSTSLPLARGPTVMCSREPACSISSLSHCA